MFLQIPEIKIDRASVLDFAFTFKESDWVSLSDTDQNHICGKVMEHPEIIKLKEQLSNELPLSKQPIKVMRFRPGCGLPIHKDFPRNAVIQIPLTSNCSETPTVFYNDDLVEIGRLEWKDDSAWLFDAQVFHSVINDTTSVRYMLVIPFFPPNTFNDIKNLYLSGKFFQ